MGDWRSLFGKNRTIMLFQLCKCLNIPVTRMMNLAKEAGITLKTQYSEINYHMCSKLAELRAPDAVATKNSNAPGLTKVKPGTAVNIGNIVPIILEELGKPPTLNYVGTRRSRAPGSKLWFRGESQTTNIHDLCSYLNVSLKELGVLANQAGIILTSTVSIDTFYKLVEARGKH